MVFTAHSIDLTKGKKTMPWTTLLAETQQCQSIFRTLNRHFAASIRSDIKIADLNSFEGGYAVEAARQGYQVTGFESRVNNFQACEFVRNHLDLPNLTFIQDEGKNLEQYGKFDAILCLDWLHRVDAPASFLQLLGGLTKEILIIDTVYAQNRYFRRGNLTKSDLLQTFREAGFDSIYEQYDWLEDMHSREGKRLNRGLFIGYKQTSREETHSSHTGRRFKPSPVLP